MRLGAKFEYNSTMTFDSGDVIRLLQFCNLPGIPHQFRQSARILHPTGLQKIPCLEARLTSRPIGPQKCRSRRLAQGQTAPGKRETRRNDVSDLVGRFSSKPKPEPPDRDIRSFTIHLRDLLTANHFSVTLSLGFCLRLGTHSENAFLPLRSIPSLALPTQTLHVPASSSMDLAEPFCGEHETLLLTPETWHYLPLISLLLFAS